MSISKQIIFVLTFCIHGTFAFSQTNHCLPPTYLKTWGQSNRSENAYVITPSRDGHLYIFGTINSKPFIQKTSLAGESLWIRGFEVVSQVSFIPKAMMEDSDGMLVGCGIQQYIGTDDRGFVFRYDPASDTFLWTHTIDSSDPAVWGIMENTPGGNFIYHQNPYVGKATMITDYDTEILELDRNTGKIKPDFAKRYGYIYIDKLTKMVAANGALYGIGTSNCRHDYSLISNRILLARFNPADGTPVWAQLSDADTSAISDYSNPDLVADGDALLALYHVDDDVTDWPDHLNPEYMHLQKTDLEGNVLWIKRYGFTGGNGMKLMVVPDGYILYGQNLVLKLDKIGDFQWGRKLPGLAPGINLLFGGLSSAAIEADSLYFTGQLKVIGSFPPNFDIVCWKMFADGSMQDSCGYISSFNIAVTDITNPIITPITLHPFPSPAVQYEAQVSSNPDALEEHLLCPQYTPLNLICPADIAMNIASGAGSIAVNYGLPTGFSGCTCPGFEFTRTEGPGSGSLFPAGETQVCYTAQDNCNSGASCCFMVRVQENQEVACDTKTNGCLKYELLGITSDAEQRYTYRFRVTNNCANKLIYTAIQLPEGLTAFSPDNLSDYTAPGGQHYEVRNPNYSPFYGIRFKSSGMGIANGASDVFEFTLPAQAHPVFFDITSRLEPQLFYEAHLNTFNCAITTANRSESAAQSASPLSDLLLYPNPAKGAFFVQLSRWEGENLSIHISDIRGQRVQSVALKATSEVQSIPLSDQLPAGVYFVEFIAEGGVREIRRLMLN